MIQVRRSFLAQIYNNIHQQRQYIKITGLVLHSKLDLGCGK